MANTKVTGDLIASSTIATGNIADNAVTSDKISGITTAHITEGSNLYYTNARADARITAATTSDLTEGTNLYYTDARADARAALLVDSAPSTLNTLNELAAALGDDPNFATTVTNSIGLKAPIASPTFTGVPSFSLNDGTFIKAVNATNNIASTNVWGYGLYEGGSKLAEISLVRDGSNNQMYIGTTTANQVLRIGTANKVTALTIDASQNATFAGSVTLTSATSDVDLIINSGADGVNDANREEGFIRFYQNNANFFSLGKRNNGQFEADFQYRFSSKSACVDFYRDKVLFSLRKVKRDFNPQKVDEPMLFEYVSWHIELSNTNLVTIESVGHTIQSNVNYRYSTLDRSGKIGFNHGLVMRLVFILE